MNIRWCGPAAAAVLLGSAVPALPLAPAQAQETCGGKTATIVVPADQFEAAGTPGDDVIVATSGAHLIRAGNGNDTVCTGAGADTVYTGGGNDWTFTAGGDDTVVVKSRKATARTSVGTDLVEVETDVGHTRVFDNDALNVDGSAGVEEVYVEQPRPTFWDYPVQTFDTPVRLTLRGGDDIIDVSAWDLQVHSGPGADRIRVDDNNTCDEEFTRAAKDSSFIRLGAGADVYRVAAGHIGRDSENLTRVEGGRGRDWVVLSDSGSVRLVEGAYWVEDCSNGYSYTDALFAGFDNVQGGPGWDHLAGSAGPNIIRGGDGQDGVNGFGGNDILIGGPDTDRARGGLGSDRCVAEEESGCER